MQDFCEEFCGHALRQNYQTRDLVGFQVKVFRCLEFFINVPNVMGQLVGGRVYCGASC